MNTIKNITVTPDETGNLSVLKYTASFTDDNGKEFTRDMRFSTILPPPTGDEYSPQELQTAAMNHANSNGVFDQLRSEAIISMTPVFDPASVPTPPPMPEDQRRANMIYNVDMRVAEVTGTFTRFQMEYESREKAAMAYRDAGYNGDPTLWITAFADAAGMDYRSATDLILQQASVLRDAVMQLGAARMNKYKIQSAPDIETALAEYNSIMAEIERIASTLP